jgi:hypothetical protein
VIIIDEDRCFDLFFKVPLIEHHTAHEKGFLLRARFPCSFVYISDERGLSLFTRFPCSFLLPLQRLHRHSILTMVTLRGRMWYLRTHDCPVTSVTIILWTQTQDKGIGTGMLKYFPIRNIPCYIVLLFYKHIYAKRRLKWQAHQLIVVVPVIVPGTWSLCLGHRHSAWDSDTVPGTWALCLL